MSTHTIECDGCGRSFCTEDPGMLAAITGPCPTCQGRFRLAPGAGAAVPAPPRGPG